MGPSRARAQRERQKMGGSVPSRVLERALVRVRAATHSLLFHPPFACSGSQTAQPISTHAPPPAPHPPTHTCRRPTFPTNPCMDLSSLGAAPIGAPRRGLTSSRRLSLAP